MPPRYIKFLELLPGPADINCDGVVDGDDVHGFVDKITSSL